MPTFQNIRNPTERPPFDAGADSVHTNLPPQSLIAIGPLFATLWQRKGLITFITAAFVALAFLYITITPKTYTATGVIVIDPQQVQVLASESAISGIGANSAAIASQVEIIQSRTLVEKVFFEQGYIADPEFAKTRLLSVILSLFTPPEPATNAQIFNNFWKRLKVERQGLTYVINVSFSSQNAQKSARIVNAIIAAYMGSQVAEKSDANAQVSELLSAQMQGLRAELSQKEAAVEAFKQANNILSVGTGGTLLQSQIEQLSAQLVVARELARAANNRYLQVAAIDADSAPLFSLFKLLTDTNSASLRTSYTQSSLALSSLQARLGPRHPSLQVASAELTRLENLIRSEARTVLTQIANEKDLTQTNADNTELELAALSRENSLSNQKEVALRDLERQAEATRLVLEQLISREKETGQLENLQRSNARVISEAVAPISPTWPKSTLLLAVAAFFGLALGTSIALFLGPRVSNQNIHSQRTGPITNTSQTEADYAANDDSQPGYGQYDHYEKHGPIYHSSELDNGAPGQFSHEPVAQATNGSPVDFEHAGPTDTDIKPAHYADPASLWTRRAAGEPYDAPANHGVTSTGDTAPNSSRITPPHKRITRESFVTELKRRREQNAIR